jgi:hypothetical protein
MTDSLLTLKTRPELLEALRSVAAKPMSAVDLLEQRVSFVYGSIDAASGVTRERVRQLILQQEGSMTVAAQ